MKFSSVVIVLIHLVFWAGSIIRYYLFPGKHSLVLLTYDHLIVAAVSYLNYFIFIPYILKKNKKTYYITWAFTFTFIFTIVYEIWWYFLSINHLNNDKEFNFIKTIITSFLISITYGGASTFARLVIEWHTNLNKTRELVIQKTNTQIQLMKSNINIPFILQSLTYAEIRAKANPQNAIQPILQLSNILRYGLYESLSERVELKKEVEALDEYIELHNQMEPANLLTLELHDYRENNFIIPNLLVKATVNWKFYIKDKLQGTQIIKLISSTTEIEIQFPTSEQPDESTLKAIFPEINNQQFIINRESSSNSISLKFLSYKHEA